VKSRSILLLLLFIASLCNAKQAEIKNDSTTEITSGESFFRIRPGYYLFVGVDYNYNGLTQEKKIPTRFEIKAKDEKIRIWDIHPIIHVPDTVPEEKEATFAIMFKSKSNNKVGNYGRELGIFLKTLCNWKVDLTPSTMFSSYRESTSCHYEVSRNVSDNMIGRTDSKYIYDGDVNGVQSFSLPLSRIYQEGVSKEYPKLKEIHAVRIFMSKNLEMIQQLVEPRSGDEIFKKDMVKKVDMSYFKRR